MSFELTRIFATKAALVAQLAARPALARTPVAWGMPGNAGSELLMVADADAVQESRALNPLTMPRSESFALDVVVIVKHGGTNQRACSERARDLGTEVGSQLREDPTVGGTLQFATITGVTLTEDYPDDNEWREARLLITLTCRARI